MSAAIKVRKLSNGRLQARRLDGKKLTDADRQEARRMIEVATAGPSFTPLTAEQAAEIDRGEVQAVLINSDVLGAPLWFAFCDDFDPGDGVPIFYADELSFLRDKPAATLRKIYDTKQACGPGTRVIQ